MSHAIRDASKECNRKPSGGALSGNIGSGKESSDDKIRPPLCPRDGMTERTVGRAASTSRLPVGKALPEPFPACHAPVRAASTTNIYGNTNQSSIGSSSLFGNGAVPQGDMVGGRRAISSFSNEPIRPQHAEMQRIVPHSNVQQNYDAIARESEQDPVDYLQEFACKDEDATAKKPKPETKFLDSFGSSMSLDASRFPNDLNQFSCGSMDFMESSDSSHRSRESFAGNMSSSRYMLPPGLSMLSGHNSSASPQHNASDDALNNLEMSVASLDISTSDMSHSLFEDRIESADESHDFSRVFDPQQPQRLGASTSKFPKVDEGDEHHDSWENLRSSVTSHTSQMTSKAGNLSHRVW